MRKIIAFLTHEVVLTISLLLALATILIVHPDSAYAGYVDWHTISMLFCLMAAVQGLVDAGLFEWLKGKLQGFARSGRQLSLLLVVLVFFISMVVTNDVSLIAFAPFTLLVYPKEDVKGCRTLIVLETIAANLGSMFLPTGNPQNLYLYSSYQIPFGSFLKAMLPLSIASLALLVLLCLTLPFATTLPLPPRESAKMDKPRLILALLQFLLCLGTVIRLVDWRITLILIFTSMLIFSRKVFAKVDYSLLATFVAFFVFSGNMARIPLVNDFINTHIAKHTFSVALIASQAISNVPAAILLSRFTNDGMALVYGTDVGGLGTLVASLASLISFKAYGKSGQSKGSYLLSFTFWNIIFLFLLATIAAFLIARF